MFKNIFKILFLFTTTLNGQDTIGGLVAKFTFNNGNPTDEVNNTFYKAVGAALTEDRFGNKRSSYYFQGTEHSYLNLGTSGLLKPVIGSVSLWFKIDNVVHRGSGVESNPIILTKSQPGDDFYEGYLIAYDFRGKKISAAVTHSEIQQASLRSVEPIALNRWYHAVLTYDDDFICFYLDGVLDNKMQKKFRSRFLQTDSVMVGYSANKKNDRAFNGYVDDIEIYNKVLSPNEVNQLYNAPNPNKNKIIEQWIIIILVIILLLIFIAWLIKKYIAKVLKREKLKNEMLNQKYEQENRTLKAQMNPHFIFNSLNTIQQFIIINQNDKAQLYLSKFSRLLRKLLESNIKDSISLKDEIELCEKYLEIESLRFNNVFNYNISVTSDIKPSGINIPHFLIQPFIENAIWHGLLPKEGNKQLLISFELLNEKTLSCKIDDNGLGYIRNIYDSDKEKKQSLAINFIKQRLDLMSKMYDAYYSLSITNKKIHNSNTEGTIITITFPILNNYA